MNKPTTGSGLVNQVENKLLTGTTGTGLNNPLQAPPPQQGVLGTGLSGASQVGATPLTGTTGLTGSTLPSSGFTGSTLPSSGFQQSGVGTGYTGSNWSGSGVGTGLTGSNLQQGTTTTGYGTTGTTSQSGGLLHKVKDALTGHHSTTGTGLTTGTTGTGYTGTGYTGQSTGFQSGVGTGLTGTGVGGNLSGGLTGDRYSTGSQFGALGPRTSETIISQPFVENVETEIISERPVLERVEKIVHKDIIEKPHILEQHEKELIEVHEQPVEKRILHPSQEFHIQEQSLYETTGQDMASLERQRILEQMRLQDMNRRVDVQERQDVRVTQQAPTVMMQQELRKEIIQKPIVTEIHEQPVVEVHEQNIHKTVYEKPLVTVVREAPIIESTITTSTPLTGLESTLTRGMHSLNLNTQPIITQQPVLQQQPILQTVQQPVISTTVVEKSLTDPSPHITANTGINPPVTRK